MFKEMRVKINKVFKLNPINMKRWTQKFITGGPGSFYRKERAYTPKNSVLTEPVIQKVQSLLNEGYGLSKIGKELNLKADTLRKAIGAGKLYRRTSRTTKDNNDEEKSKKKQKSGV